MLIATRFLFLIVTTIHILFSCGQKDTLFTALSSSKTGIFFANKLEKKPLLNILYYLYYYNGGGVATGDVNNDGLPDIYFTANRNGGNKLYLNKGNFSFEDVTEAAGVAGTADWCSGATMADVNGDGLLDIYVATVSNAFGLKGHNLLYINNGLKEGKPAFTEKSAAYGLAFQGLSTQAAFFDYDHDGDLDCYLLNHSQHPNANITDTINRRKKSAQSGDVLYRNEINTGAETFTDVSAQAGIYQSNLGYGLGLAVADFNNDGWEDVYVGNDFHENDYYYINNGRGGFTESGANHFGHYSRFSMGNDAADFNNDGQMDLITVDMLPPDERVLKTYGSDENPDIYKVKLQANGYQFQYSRNALQRNNGDGSSFSEIALLSGVAATDWSWCPLFADFDNDGNKDLFISSGIVKRPVDLDYVRFVSDLQMRRGMDRTDKFDDEALETMPDGAVHPFVFKGDGGLQFQEVSHTWGTAELNGYFNGAAYADLDNDGDLDMVINALNAEAVVLQNQTEKSNYLSVTMEGEKANRLGIGTKVYLFQKGRMQYQQVMATRGFQSASDTRLHFGLGANAAIDSLLIVWPDQQYQVVRNPKSNQLLRLQKKGSGAPFNYTNFFPKKPALFQRDSSIGVNWTHTENDFLDFNVQYLIPHAQSTRGPKLAVGDINGDKLDDFYVGGAAGQPGALFLQTANGQFTQASQDIFLPDAACEDVDALFFDANGDGHKDLYVVSGGNQLTGNHPALLDRLYLNDGRGRMAKAPIPAFFGNKSCVASADIDKDGDQDLLVGTLADAKAYGLPQTSYLLLNDGKGSFASAPKDRLNLAELGMVTSALFADLNKDTWPDLVIAGEWMPITVFMNQRGTFTKQAVASSTGWWQSLYADDVNGDGFTDMLAGNWGWNNKFNGARNGPVKLYVSDFDRNGSTDQLLSYTVGGKEFPFLAKDEAERALPELRKHYLKYADFAGLEMKDAYYGYAEKVTPLQAESLGSAVLLGDGKGNFVRKTLSASLQLAPVFAFAKTGVGEYLSGGNFFDVIPYEGRYDAQPLAVFRTSPTGDAETINLPDLTALRQQVRDIKPVRMANGKTIFAVACNRGPLLFYQPSKP